MGCDETLQQELSTLVFSWEGGGGEGGGGSWSSTFQHGLRVYNHSIPVGVPKISKKQQRKYRALSPYHVRMIIILTRSQFENQRNRFDSCSRFCLFYFHDKFKMSHANQSRICTRQIVGSPKTNNFGDDDALMRFAPHRE